MVRSSCFCKAAAFCIIWTCFIDLGLWGWRYSIMKGVTSDFSNENITNINIHKINFSLWWQNILAKLKIEKLRPKEKPKHGIKLLQIHSVSMLRAMNWEFWGNNSPVPPGFREREKERERERERLTDWLTSRTCDLFFHNAVKCTSAGMLVFIPEQKKKEIHWNKNRINNTVLDICLPEIKALWNVPNCYVVP